MSHQRILAKLARDEFVGRDAELHRLISYSSQPNERKLLLLAAPNAGGSEFLRQAYDNSSSDALSGANSFFVSG